MAISSTRLWNIISGKINSIKNHYFIRNLRKGLRVYLSDSLTLFFLFLFSIAIFLAIFGPMLTPYEYDEVQMTDDGLIKQAEPPSSEHWLGTTAGGYDVLSRLMYGARPTVLTGLMGGSLIVGIGLLVGVISGYFGGLVDGILMRATDFIYSIPLIPAAIVLIAYLGMGFWNAILLIGLLLWRGNARVFRSQVLQIREREHVEVAEMIGASKRYIILRHIIPNMGGMIVLFFALGTGLTILITASLAFLGFMNPFIPSWGVILRNAYQSSYMSRAWWWTLSAGFAISLTVLSIYMLGRGYERVQQETFTEVE